VHYLEYRVDDTRLETQGRQLSAGVVATFGGGK
jgi:hypothetical protein